VVRRHPDIKWLRRPADIESFARQQVQILEALWELLDNGGKLLYSTCSIFAKENQLVIDSFLAKYPEASQEKMSLLAEIAPTGQLLPDEQHDGFYYALLHKHH
jgi:16S rRNA (cytosine967-C5)-methyltransferase